MSSWSSRSIALPGPRTRAVRLRRGHIEPHEHTVTSTHDLVAVPDLDETAPVGIEHHGPDLVTRDDPLHQRPVPETSAQLAPETDRSLLGERTMTLALEQLVVQRASAGSLGGGQHRVRVTLRHSEFDGQLAQIVPQSHRRRSLLERCRLGDDVVEKAQPGTAGVERAGDVVVMRPHQRLRVPPGQRSLALPVDRPQAKPVEVHPNVVEPPKSRCGTNPLDHQLIGAGLPPAGSQLAGERCRVPQRFVTGRLGTSTA